MARRIRRFEGNEDLIVVSPPRDRKPETKPDPETEEMRETLRKPRSEG